jgi:NADH pyrophosphatase NudC (nudix superfamily)
MIGCIAKATSDTLHMDESEMDDVRWVGRDQLKKAVEDSKRKDTPYQGQFK